jgi:hypothetical protein
MDTITLTYDGQHVALAGRERFWLAAHIEALPDGHPTKRLISVMALFARDVLTGDLPGPYTEERARSFARLALVDPNAYHAHRRCQDTELAAVIGLPVSEIPDVRREQHIVAAARWSGRPRRGRVPHGESMCPVGRRRR